METRIGIQAGEQKSTAEIERNKNPKIDKIVRGVLLHRIENRKIFSMLGILSL